MSHSMEETSWALVTQPQSVEIRHYEPNGTIVTLHDVPARTTAIPMVGRMTTQL